MSAPITEAHYDLRRQVIFSDADAGAELIADSEARAVEPWRTQVEELRGALALGQENCDDVFDDLREERDQLRAEVERLKADGAASVFVNMASRASRAETDRNNLRADLDAIKAILTEEKARAERAEAELATERADKNSWKAKCHELIAPHYILDPCLRAQKFRDALAYHPVLT